MTFSSLVLGNFDLTDWSGMRYNTSVIAEGTSRGGPTSIDVAVQSWLQDGSVVITQGYDNREVSLRVRLRGPDLLDLAKCEAALFAELGKPNLLTWTPPDGFGPPSVFEVVTSSMVEAPSAEGDLAEMAAFPWRTYNLRLVCKAFVRSVDEVVAEAIGAGNLTSLPAPVTVTVDDGSSTSGWSGTYHYIIDNGTVIESAASTVSVISGSINSLTPAYTYHDPTPYFVQVEAYRAGTVDVSTLKQMVVRWRWDSSDGDLGSWFAQNFRLLVHTAANPGVAVLLQQVSGVKTPGRAEFVDAIFQIPASMTSIVAIRPVVNLTTGNRNLGQQQSVNVDSITLNNANTTVSTPRQLVRTVDVAGSARTQGTVEIMHNTSALGDVLFYSWPEIDEVYSPPLRQYRTSGAGVTTDTALVSGARENLVGGSVVYDIPVANLPKTSHLLMLRLGGADTLTTLSWSATTRIGSNDVGPTVSGSLDLDLDVAYKLFPIAKIDLPTRAVGASSAAKVRITLSATVAVGSTANIDEGWLFSSIGRLLQASCGTGLPASGGPSNRMWVSPATLTEPRPSVRVGNLASGSDARFPDFLRWQFPEFKPPLTNVFTVTTNALDAAVTLKHFPTWHSHAAL